MPETASRDRRRRRAASPLREVIRERVAFWKKKVLRRGRVRVRASTLFSAPPALAPWFARPAGRLVGARALEPCRLPIDCRPARHPAAHIARAHCPHIRTKQKGDQTHCGLHWRSRDGRSRPIERTPFSCAITLSLFRAIKKWFMIRLVLRVDLAVALPAGISGVARKPPLSCRDMRATRSQWGRKWKKDPIGSQKSHRNVSASLLSHLSLRADPSVRVCSFAWAGVGRKKKEF